MIIKNDLLDWLKEVDEKLQYKIVVVAVGGTAMTLLGLKASTRDVDFCVEGKHSNMFRKITKNDTFKVDLFFDGFIFSEQLPEDYVEKSNKILTPLSNMDLRTLSLIDIIITKVARYNARDEEDIETITKTNLVNRQELEERFKQSKC